MDWKAIVPRPAWRRYGLAGVVITLLAVAAAGALAQSGGDPPGATAAASSQQAEPASGEPGGDQPAGEQTGGEEAAVAPASADGDMFAAAAPLQGAAPQQAAAAVGSQITYQGVLKDGSSAANGLFDMRFRLFDDANAGSQRGEFIASGVPVVDGQFTTLLDFGPAVYAGQALWLEIAVTPAGDPGYETLTPRQPVTPAPLALSLPNVSTDPATGYVTIGNGKRVSSFTHLGINADYNGWAGMYISGGGPEARPFYGYATDDEGAFSYAWTELNGAAGEWQLYIQGAERLTVNAAGDISQPVSGGGLVKAAAYVECWHEPAFLTVYSSFNTVTGAPVTAATGPAQGECYVNFGFDLSNRFFNATAVQAGAARGVTCDVDGGNNNRLRCMRWRVTDTGAEGWGGRIMVQVY
jgi:trimeric autotransporter adhesin